MGGHAFRDLRCPRISPEIYSKVKLHAATALGTVFSHVVVPTELPEKKDYGDIDFLVSDPFHSPTSISDEAFDWDGTIKLIKSALGTCQGRRGVLTFGCMFFAIRAPGHEDENLWVQIDVKVCFKPELFEWQTYEWSYATLSKMKGSMVKPLGLTIDSEGLHVRVEDMDETNFPGSMVWVSRDPRDVLRVMGLDRRVLDASIGSMEELYEYFAGSWLFNPAHFAARLAEENYANRLEDRSPHWVDFITKWIPSRYPGYQFPLDDSRYASNVADPLRRDLELKAWNKSRRLAVREKVFTMFPHVAQAYYTKRASFVKEREEQRLKAMIAGAIPSGEDGWRDDLPQPRITVKQSGPATDTSESQPIASGELTPPIIPGDKVFPTAPSLKDPSSFFLAPQSAPWDVPLHLDALPRDPPYTWRPSPPPPNMGPDKKVLCIARWTRFDTDNGRPYLLPSARDKDFEMLWIEASYAGATDSVLVDWTESMWWHIWLRQSRANYVGMWKSKFAKEDRVVESKRERDGVGVGLGGQKAGMKARETREKVLARLRALNVGLGLLETGAAMA